jgi:hypothetical protein
VPGKIRPRPAERLAEIADLRGGEGACLANQRLGDGVVEILDLRDGHFILATLWAPTDVNPQEGEPRDSTGVVPKILPLGLHLDPTHEARHRGILHAVITTNCVSDRNATTT